MKAGANSNTARQSCRSAEMTVFPNLSDASTPQSNREILLKRRETELALVQRIAGVGGVEVDLTDGYRNRRSPEYLLIHGLPPEAVNEIPRGLGQPRPSPKIAHALSRISRTS